MWALATLYQISCQLSGTRSVCPHLSASGGFPNRISQHGTFVDSSRLWEKPDWLTRIARKWNKLPGTSLFGIKCPFFIFYWIIVNFWTLDPVLFLLENEREKSSTYLNSFAARWVLLQRKNVLLFFYTYSEKMLKKETKIMEAAKGGEVKKYKGGGSVRKNKSNMITKRGWGASRKT